MKRKLYLPMLALSLLLFMASACFYFYLGWGNQQTKPSTGPPGKADGNNQTEQQLPQVAQDKTPQMEAPLNILVVGIDKGGTINGPPRPKPWRSDVIILVRVDREQHKVSLLSIPRDTRVYSPKLKAN